ncbi:hypothetical protein C8R47DRAFT_1062653 [Mycena vitilis]|nr:hypothetical protein C8R47DRAFT_1062653 [Mycena vitilis]
MQLLVAFSQHVPEKLQRWALFNPGNRLTFFNAAILLVRTFFCLRIGSIISRAQCIADKWGPQQNPTAHESPLTAVRGSFWAWSSRTVRSAAVSVGGATHAHLVFQFPDPALCGFESSGELYRPFRLGTLQLARALMLAPKKWARRFSVNSYILAVGHILLSLSVNIRRLVFFARKKIAPFVATANICVWGCFGWEMPKALSTRNPPPMPYDPVRAAIDWQRLQADLSLFGLVCERTREDLYTEGLELRREIEALLSETSDAEFADLRETVTNGPTERRIIPCKALGSSSATLLPSAIAVDVDCRPKPETVTVGLKRRRQSSISSPPLFTAESPHVFDAGSGDTGAESTGIRAVILESAFRESPASKKQKVR